MRIVSPIPFEKKKKLKNYIIIIDMKLQNIKKLENLQTGKLIGIPGNN